MRWETYLAVEIGNGEPWITGRVEIVSTENYQYNEQQSDQSNWKQKHKLSLKAPFTNTLDNIFEIQLTLVISTSLISNNCLSRSENLVPA